ncbi:hypothetical protein WJX72_005546 [[Myrmecia] bisecta]|uniref:RNase III domain-containing protein n=1 Tax=[Myrmecia] bisecta TaxID=41462 RepID=A0AAW1P4V6_9CHLO
MLEAFTHCSWPDLEPQCYQRLEFLGDVVLDFCITRHYILTYRDLQPGKMHDIRSASVNNGCLACIAAVSGLHRHLRHCSPSVFAQVSLFLQEVAHTVKQHAGEEASAAGLEKVGDEARHMAYQWATQASFSSTTTAPKVLADLLESVTGAVYEDAGRDLEATWKVVQKLVQPMVTPTNCPMHPVRELQERCQFLGLELVYQTEYGQPGDVTMTVLIQGIPAGRHEGWPNKRTSMKFAAEDALEHWMERVQGKVDRPLPSLETAPNSCMMTHK